MIRLRLLLLYLRKSCVFFKLSRKLPHIQRALVKHLDAYKKQKAEYDGADQLIPQASEKVEHLKELSEKAYSLGFDQRTLVGEFLARWEAHLEFFSFGKKFTNLSLFVILCLQDLLLVLQSSRGRIKSETVNFARRLIALQCYEITEKLLHLLGNHRLSRTGAEFLNPNTNREIKRAVFEIRQLKKENADQWELVRNKCVAHRDDDAFLQLSLIESLDPLKLQIAGMKLIATLSRLGTCLTRESHNRSKRAFEFIAELQGFGARFKELQNKLPTVSTPNRPATS
jgi:hypothetical protein